MNKNDKIIQKVRKRLEMRVLLINHFPLQGSGSGVYVTNIAKSLQKKRT